MVILFNYLQVFAQIYPTSPSGAIVEVVYPRDRDENGFYTLLKGIDSTFLLGNVRFPTETKLLINQKQIEIDSGGGWLAWVKCPSKNENFTWVIRAIYHNDTVVLKLPVKRTTIKKISDKEITLKNPIWVKTKNGARLQLQPGGQNFLLPIDGTVFKVFRKRGNYYAVKTEPNELLWVNKDNTEEINKPDVITITSCEIEMDPHLLFAKISFGVNPIPLYKVEFDTFNLKKFSIRFFQTNIDKNFKVPNHEWFIVNHSKWKSQQQFDFTILNQEKCVGYIVTKDTSKLIFKFKFPPSENLKNDTLPLHGWKICIDPGHGGEQYGAIGPTWLSEKDVNLRVANLLRRKLEKLGASVIQTRTEDITLSLPERVQIADEANAHILLSIHQNALPDGQNPWYQAGTTTYYFYPHSKPLGELIQQNLSSKLDLGNNGLYVGDFAMVRYSGALSVLTEATFIIRPDHERLLKNPLFLNLQAEAIAEGIVQYVQSN